jgi:hypothetical protein
MTYSTAASAAIGMDCTENICAGRQRGSELEFRWDQEFSLLHVVQTGSEAHPASYPVDTGGTFRGGKAAGS